jgi:hypothetical protein
MTLGTYGSFYDIAEMRLRTEAAFIFSTVNLAALPIGARFI